MPVSVVVRNVQAAVAIKVFNNGLKRGSSGSLFLVNIYYQIMHKVALVNISSPLGRLYQTHQITKDGMHRLRNMPNLSETLDKPFESYLKGAVRGVKEELGLNISKNRFKHVHTWKETKPSPTTGVIKKYEFGLFNLELSLEEAQQVTLEVDEGPCTTYFEWRE